MRSDTLLHETATRLRLRLPADADLAQGRVALELVSGVRSVRTSPAARSITVHYDGRAVTRHAILDLMPTLSAPAKRAPAARRDRGAEPQRGRDESLPIEVSLLATALMPVLPPPASIAVAVALVGGKTLQAWRAGANTTAVALDAIALAVSALTGHPFTSAASVLMGSVAEKRRNRMLREMDRLLEHLAPDIGRTLEIDRHGDRLRIETPQLVPGDRVKLGVGAIVPADGIVVSGRAELNAQPLAVQPTRWIERGERVVAGARVLGGDIELRVERPAARSRNARLRDHVRHVLRTRDAPGPLTPDLERLIAVPITAAGLVLGLTGDAARTASMLQADPQLGISLAQPVAREAAVYATARHGALLSGLESLDRLATATTFAFEDVGVLAEPYWTVERVIGADAAEVDAAQARRWLSRLAGHDDATLVDAGLPDEQVAAWREHGAVLRDGGRVLHVGGAALLERTWSLPLLEPDRSSLVRRLGVVDNGRLLATVHLGCRVRPQVAEHFARLRALGVKHIAVFTEDPADQPARALMQLGADIVVSHDRRAQERWLDAAVERGERVALVHTGLRDLLPPGGLSLCPVDADAGAHGVLLGEPLPSLLAARHAAIAVRRELRRQFGRSVTLNAGLMVAAAMRWVPPIATTSIKHGLAFLLLAESARLARLDVAARTSRPRSPSTQRARPQQHDSVTV